MEEINKSKKELKIIAIVLIIVMTITGTFTYLALKEAHKQNERINSEIIKCKELPECESYKCIAQLPLGIDYQRNYLLMEQNCLLRQKK